MTLELQKNLGTFPARLEGWHGGGSRGFVKDSCRTKTVASKVLRRGDRCDWTVSHKSVKPVIAEQRRKRWVPQVSMNAVALLIGRVRAIRASRPM